MTAPARVSPCRVSWGCPPKGRALVFVQQVSALLPGSLRAAAADPCRWVPSSSPCSGPSPELPSQRPQRLLGPVPNPCQSIERAAGIQRLPALLSSSVRGHWASLQLTVSGPPGPVTSLCCLQPAPSLSPAAPSPQQCLGPALLLSVALLLLPRRMWARGSQVHLC